MQRDSDAQPRQRTVAHASETAYDLAVIGGGIAGAGVARDAAMRGLETILVEQTDFGSGTTAWSTRLVHGGLRYLEQLDFRLVFESLQEREVLADIAPHLVDPLPFLIPQYDESLPTRVKLSLGMVLYDLLSLGKSMPWHDRLSGAELREMEPAIPDQALQGGFCYHDRQVEFVERLCLETVLDAAEHDADVLNHARVTDIRKSDDRVSGLTVHDTLGGQRFEVDSDTVVNATGPWIDDVLPETSADRLVRATKGIHVVLPKLTEYALTLPTTDDRVMFVVPWNGFSLLGTTDTDYTGDPADARATAEDVDYLLEEAGRFFPDLDRSDILYTYAGVRPLYDSGTEADASAVSRRHEVVEHAPEYPGLFSLVGAKITPYRKAAEDATDAVATYLGVEEPCRTADVPLPGARGDTESIDTFSQETLDHLERLYGVRRQDVIQRVEADETLASPLCPHTDDILAQVVVAVEEEYARSLTDVLLRRCTVGFEECQGLDAVETVAETMAELLDWDDERTAAEIDRYESVIERTHAYESDRR